jgi:hypothetical protein
MSVFLVAFNHQLSEKMEKFASLVAYKKIHKHCIEPAIGLQLLGRDY